MNSFDWITLSEVHEPRAGFPAAPTQRAWTSRLGARRRIFIRPFIRGEQKAAGMVHHEAAMIRIARFPLE